MRAILITVGDELLIGQVVNTNAAWLGEQLTTAGVDVVRAVSVGDELDDIRAELEAALRGAELVILTGGLGPTHDDVTKTAVAEHFGAGLVFDPETFARIEARFRRRGVAMSGRNRSQALVPEGFEALPNDQGTAPGLWAERETAEGRRFLALLPGVPHEMKHLVLEQLLPRLVRATGRRTIVQKTLLTAGIAESTLAERIGDLDGWLGPGLRLAFLPGGGGVRLRLTARGDDEAAARTLAERFEAFLRERAGRYIYGADGDTLEAVVGRMLAARGLTVAAAESCTGGALLDRLTDVPGSSAYVLGGIIAYGNDVKIRQLGVEPAALAEEGAVSERVARQMAEGVRRRLGASIGLSTTGIAGPGGGSADKPVGTVWLGYADGTRSLAAHVRFVGDRRHNKQLSVTAALDLLRREAGREESGSAEEGKSGGGGEGRNP